MLCISVVKSVNVPINVSNNNTISLNNNRSITIAIINYVLSL